MTDEIREQADSTLAGSAAPEPVTNTVTLPNGVVTLHERVPFEMGAAVRIAIAMAAESGGSEADVRAAYSNAIFHHAVASWTFPEPVTFANIDRLLPWSSGGMEVAEAADARFGSEVMAPLVRQQLERSQTTQTASSTPPTTDSGSPLPTPSKPSSPRRTGGRRSKR